MTKILVIDNYDSFVYTIVGYLTQMGADCHVVRNDDVPTDANGEVAVTDYAGVLVSPGPGTPADAGQSIDAIRACAQTATPMLGVCLGHQALGEFYSGTVTHSPELMHGKTSSVFHQGKGVFAGIPDGFTATRYHSLAVVNNTVSDELEVTAATESGIIMGLQHRELPLHGVQFHPESVLTEHGHRLFANWLAMTDGRDASARSEGLAPLVA